MSNDHYSRQHSQSIIQKITSIKSAKYKIINDTILNKNMLTYININI